MTTRVSSKIPFVNLHAHSVAGSIFDAIGYPQEHMDFAYENGCDALALTDHGNMNGLAHQVLHAKALLVLPRTKPRTPKVKTRSKPIDPSNCIPKQIPRKGFFLISNKL